jgi:hypothetical protein
VTYCVPEPDIAREWVVFFLALVVVFVAPAREADHAVLLRRFAREVGAFVADLPEDVALGASFPIESILAQYFEFVLAVGLIVFGQVALEAELLFTNRTLELRGSQVYIPEAFIDPAQSEL